MLVWFGHWVPVQIPSFILNLPLKVERGTWSKNASADPGVIAKRIPFLHCLCPGALQACARACAGLLSSGTHDAVTW